VDRNLLGLRTESEAVKISVLLEAFDYVEEPAQLDYIEAARIYRIFRAKGYTLVDRRSIA
jgi:hypothetical protein